MLSVKHRGILQIYICVFGFRKLENLLNFVDLLLRVNRQQTNACCLGDYRLRIKLRVHICRNNKLGQLDLLSEEGADYLLSKSGLFNFSPKSQQKKAVYSTVPGAIHLLRPRDQTGESSLVQQKKAGGFSRKKQFVVAGEKKFIVSTETSLLQQEKTVKQFTVAGENSLLSREKQLVVVLQVKTLYHGSKIIILQQDKTVHCSRESSVLQQQETVYCGRREQFAVVGITSLLLQDKPVC